MSRHQETLQWPAPRAWCWKCREFVGLPRLTQAEALGDVRAHRKAQHAPAAPKGDDLCVKCGESRGAIRSERLICWDGYDPLGRHLFIHKSEPGEVRP